MTRLQFMYFIKDLQNLFDMVYQLKNILKNQSKIQSLTDKYQYAKRSLFTLINTYSNSEVKSIIKDVHGDGCKALKLFQVRCARITPQDTVRIKEKFNNTRIEPSENPTRYIRRFYDARLLAKSVGMVVEESKIIDKFLLCMTGNKRYFLIIQHSLTQRRNKELTPSYNFSKLTMTEVESRRRKLHDYFTSISSTSFSL